LAEYLAPGVIVEEMESGPIPIEGVPTDVGAFVGLTERGPVLEPKCLSSWNDYLKHFGSFISDSYTAEGVFGFFENGGRECYVVRVNAGASDLTAHGEVQVLDPARLKSGFVELEKVDDPVIVACPDASYLADPNDQIDVNYSIISHCEFMKRFAIIDAPNDNDDDAILDWRMKFDSTYAALYSPWLDVANQRPSGDSKQIQIPPSGHVMGIYARTDQRRGVHKVPANEEIRGIVGLAKNHTDQSQARLNSNSMNLIRQIPGRGALIWGGRCLTQDAMWRYINIRRLAMYIHSSIDRGTQWVAYEPNDATTWSKVRVFVEDFLNKIWREGGLIGTTPKEAYSVRIGLGETMTQTDIDVGRLIIEVAIAPLKPAEFVVIRIGHKPSAD